MSVRSFPRPYIAAGTDHVGERLAGTIWAKHASAHSLYRAVHVFGTWLASLGISANALTYTSLGISAAAAWAAATGHFGWAALLVLVSGACDALDGVVARATQTQSAFGALLDSTVDRVADALPLLALVLYFAPTPWMVTIPLVALVGGFSISYVRARAHALGSVLPPLFMRRAERVLLLTFSLLLGAAPVDLDIDPHLWSLFGVALIALLNLVGLVAALRAAARDLDGRQVSAVATKSER